MQDRQSPVLNNVRHAIVIFGVGACVIRLAMAGPVFDDLLNYPVVDQRCPAELIKEEGLGLVVRDANTADAVILSPTQPVGQSFVLGPDMHVLWRVSTGIFHWPDDWTENESVTFTLWDSPRKTRQFYTRTIPFRFKWHKWDVPFDCHVQAPPGTSFYFELSHNGGDDNRIRVVRIPRDAYPPGEAYIAGEPQTAFDLYFVTLAKPQRDRLANLRMFLDRMNLDHPLMALAKSAQARNDLDAACGEVLKAFEAHLRTLDGFWLAKPGSPPDERAVRLLQEGRYYKNANATEDDAAAYVELSEQTTWREVWPGTADYINRSNDLFAWLGQAYRTTGDPRYAALLDRFMVDFMQDNASPFEGGMRGGRWVAMFIAWRMGDAWDGYVNAIDAPELSADTRLGWIDYWARMMYFARHEPTGGNHANAVAQAMLKFTVRFPLYRESQANHEWAFDLLVRNSLEHFHEDGSFDEPAMNYHGFALGNLLSGLDIARESGASVPPEIEQRVVKALAYTAFALMPNGQIPSYGDTDCQEFDARTLLWNGWRTGEAAQGAMLSGRQDLLYIATAGKVGSPPTAASYAFPDIGHYFLRSGWGGENGERFADSRYLFFRAGRLGSHGHHDLNMVVLYAYGRPLLIDPGRTTYGTPLMAELSRPQSHNVLLVEGHDRMNHAEPTIHRWETGPVWDVADAEYSALYPGVAHRRVVLFVRPDYYWVFDRAIAHSPVSMGVNYWLVPPDVTVDRQVAMVHTNDPAGANVLLHVASRHAIRITDRHGTLDKGGIRDDIPVVTFWNDGVARADFATLLLPFPGAVDAAGHVTSTTSSDEGNICMITRSGGTDIVAYHWAPTRASAGNVEIEAQAGLVRLDTAGQPLAVALVLGRAVVLRGETIVSSDRLVASASVQYLDGIVDVQCPSAEPSLAVATLGRRWAVVNGTMKRIADTPLYPFTPSSKGQNESSQ